MYGRLIPFRDKPTYDDVKKLLLINKLLVDYDNRKDDNMELQELSDMLEESSTLEPIAKDNTLNDLYDILIDIFYTLI
jgi:hypothetical protein